MMNKRDRDAANAATTLQWNRWIEDAELGAYVREHAMSILKPLLAAHDAASEAIVAGLMPKLGITLDAIHSERVRRRQAGCAHSLMFGLRLRDECPKCGARR